MKFNLKENIVSVGIYWHNDVQEGFGIRLTDPDEVAHFCQQLAAHYERFKATSAKEQKTFLDKVVFEQLADAVRIKDDSAQQQAFLVCGPFNVFILEQEGLLTPVNDFNGCVFIEAVK